MNELKLSEDDESKVYKQVKAWKDKGMITANKDNIGDILKEAHEVLKAKGEIGKAAATEKSPEELEKEEKAKKEAEEKAAKEKAAKEEEEKKKKDANAKINRGANGAPNAQAQEKKPISQLRRSLDDVVFSHRND